MDIRHRDKIRRNLIFLLENIPLDSMVDYLQENSILTTDHREEIYHEITTRDRIRRLLLIVQTRGRHAYQELCNAFLVSDRLDIVAKLQAQWPPRPKVRLYRWMYIRSADRKIIKTSDYWFLSLEECRVIGETEEPIDCGAISNGPKPLMVIEVSEE